MMTRSPMTAKLSKRVIAILAAAALLLASLSCPAISASGPAQPGAGKQKISHGTPAGSGDQNMNGYVNNWAPPTDENTASRRQPGPPPAPEPPDATGDYVHGWTFPTSSGKPGPENPERVRKPVSPPSPNHNTKDYINGWTDQSTDQSTDKADKE